MTNAGSVPATDTRLNITLPAATAYEANSFSILSNAGGETGAQTDAAGDDLGEVSGERSQRGSAQAQPRLPAAPSQWMAQASVKYRVKATGMIASQTVLATSPKLRSRSASTDPDRPADEHKHS